jgi:RNA polymerase sigma-70 factor (ECF subfamily)
MCLVAARLPGRLDPNGDLVPLNEQDRASWDPSLVRRGIEELNRSATGEDVTPFHLEAAIAYEHTVAPSHAETSWGRIVPLYDALHAVRPSPVVALSRAIAVGELEGPVRALEELAKIEGRERLERSPFYAAAVGEEQLRAGRLEAARESLRTALALARSPAERRYLERRLAKCA